MRLNYIIALSLLAVGARAQDLAVVGGRIEIGNGKSLNKGTVLIRGGKITAVGENVAVPSGVSTLDATGQVVYPGFIDACTTSGLKLPAAPETPAPRDITAAAPPTMWEKNRRGIFGRNDASSALDLAGSLADAHKAGITAALFAPGSGLVRGQMAVGFMTDTKQTAQPFGYGLSFRGTGGTGYPGTLLGFTALLRQTIADAEAYNRVSGPSEDLDLKGMAPLVKKSTPAVFFVDSDTEIYRALSIADEFGFTPILVGARDAYLRAEQLVKRKVPVLVNINVGSEPGLTSQADGPPKEVLEERRADWRERATNVQKLDAANVLFAFSSESGNYDNHLSNVRRLIQLGLKKDAALRGLTINPATVFEREKDLGTVEVGKFGNLTLMSGDFADGNSKVTSVVVAGKRFEVKP